MSLQDFMSKFPPTSPAQEVKLETEPEIITRTQAYNLINERMTSGYSSRVCSTLTEIIRGLDLSWAGKKHQTADIHDERALCSTKPAKLQAKIKACSKTLQRCMKTLITAGLVTVHPGAAKMGQDQHSVNLRSLKAMPTKAYKTNQSRKRYQHDQYLKRKDSQGRKEVARCV